MCRILAFLLTALAAFAEGPRLGKYNCYSFGAVGNPPILIVSFELKSGGEYRTVGKTGKYSYDDASKTVTWITGVNKDNNYTGKFEVENKTHKIRIRPRTVCTNTTP
jgi:hypothetical protein